MTRVSYLVAMPCMLMLLLGIVCMVILGDGMPSSVRDLQAVYVSWKQWSSLRDRYQALVLLAIVHTLQVVFCFPFTNITRTMYGYVFGFWHGLAVACAWEIALFLLYLFVASHCSHPQGAFFPTDMLEYVKTWQGSRFLFAVLLVVHMTSIPLVSKSALFRQDAVTSFDFVASFVLATVLLSAKDTLAGEYIAQSDDSAENIAFYTLVVLCSSLLPGLLTTLFVIRICASQPGTHPNMQNHLETSRVETPPPSRMEYDPEAARIETTPLSRANSRTPPPSRAQSMTPPPSRAPNDIPQPPSPVYYNARDSLLSALSPSSIEELALEQPPKQEIPDTQCFPESFVHTGGMPPLRPPRREVRVVLAQQVVKSAADGREPSSCTE